jgi:hypothetical protein
MLMKNSVAMSRLSEASYRNHPHLPAHLLQISEDELDALLWFRELLEQRELFDLNDDKLWGQYEWGDRITDRAFDIGETCKQTNDCGTVACIGGWMALSMGIGDEFTERGREAVTNWVMNYGRFDGTGPLPRSKVLDRLFLPMHYPGITGSHFRGAWPALKAIDRFLLGESDPYALWSAALPKCYSALLDQETIQCVTE